MPGSLEPIPERQPERSYFGLIMAAAIIGALVVWTYIFFGAAGVGVWAKIGASVLAVAFIGFAWQWRREREKKHIDMLEKWAERESAASTRPGRDRR